MLTRIQLEDAAKCRREKKCMTCKMTDTEGNYKQDCVRLSAQTALALADMVKRLEWVHVEIEEYEVDMCPMCKRRMADGHKPDCEIAAILRGLEGDK